MKNETFTPERIKAEADAFFEWDGEDRSLVTTTSCLLFAQHIAGLIQDRAAQPAPVVPEGSIYVECRQCDKCQHVGINDAAHGLAACHDCDWSGNEPEDDKCPGCKSENCMAAACPECGARYALIASEDVAAAPAQGQQVECQECERLREENERLGWDYAAARNAHDSCLADLVATRAELSALKAQQVGQEPFGYLADDGGSMVAFFRAEEKDQFDAFCAEAEPLNKVALYTAPQPAPAQGVAGSIVLSQEGAKILAEAIGAHAYVLGALVNGRPDLAMNEAKKWVDGFMDAGSSVTAHDKQSGGEV